MADEKRKPIHITETTRIDLVKRALEKLAASLHANGLWLGLPEEILAKAAIDFATPAHTLLDWLPSSAQGQTAQPNECMFGQGISAQAAQIGDQMFPDRQPGPFWALAPIPLDNQYNAWLLITRDRPVNTSELNEVFDHTLALVASMIERQIYQQSVSQYRCSLETIHTISLRIASTLEIGESLGLLAQAALEILPADAALIFIHSKDMEAGQPYLLGADAWRNPAQKLTKDPPIPDQLLKLAADRSWPLFIEDIQSHPSYAEMQSYGCQGGLLMAYPLKRQGRSFGVFLIHIFEPRTIIPEERYMLSLISDQALAALENAHTARMMSYQLAELAALQRMAQKITITLETQEVLQVIVQTLQSLLNASAASIMLIDDNHILRRTATAGNETYLPDPMNLNPGEGFAGRVAVSARPLSIANLQEEEKSARLQTPVKAIYIYPLKLQNRVIGVLSVVSMQPHAFGEAAERIIAIASVQASVSLENSRLYHAELRRADELKTIIDVSHLITQQLDPDLIFDAAYQAISHLMKAEAFVISILDRQTSEVLLTYAIDKGVRYPALRRSGGKGLSEYVIKTGNVVLIDALENQEIPFEVIRFGSAEAVHSVLAVPLQAGGKSIGMVAAESYQIAAYTQHNLELLQSIANAIASAVENSHLYAELEARYQKLQKSETRRLAFIQDVSHELRNPLTFLKGYIDLLLSGEMGTLTDEQRQALSIVNEKTNTLARLVSEIATLQTSSPHLLQIEQIDILRIIRNAVLLAQEACQEKNIILILDAPASVPPIHADPDRIAQVVDNLLSNAIKFGYPDSQVIVRLQEQAEAIQVSVLNSGDPIPESAHSKIFERFFRLSPRKDGLGLGLAIVKHIIEAHHGEVWFESEAGKDNALGHTTFYFSIPRRQATVQTAVEV